MRYLKDRIPPQLQTPTVVVALAGAFAAGLAAAELRRRALDPPRSSKLPAAVAIASEPAAIGLDLEEHCRQIAIATLLSQRHEINSSTVVFQRDPTKRGNAVQQFADVFGRAIRSRSNPTPGFGLDAERRRAGGRP